MNFVGRPNATLTNKTSIQTKSTLNNLSQPTLHKFFHKDSQQSPTKVTHPNVTTRVKKSALPKAANPANDTLWSLAMSDASSVDSRKSSVSDSHLGAVGGEDPITEEQI